MIGYFIEKLLNVSFSEFPRVFYAWLVKFFMSFGRIIGWTALIAVSIVDYSIWFLPVVILAQALFTIAGSMIFSLFIRKISDICHVNISLFAAILFLFVGFIFQGESQVLLVMILIANGIFLSQANIALASYLEEKFMPSEAERVVSIIESSETIGGILAGILLVSLSVGNMLASSIVVWMISLIFLVLVLNFVKPDLPYFIKILEKKKEVKKEPVNSLYASLREIRRVPFLQILISVLVFHWIIANFLEFIFAKSVEETIHESASSTDHENSLIHGLGFLHVIFHSSALLIEILIAGRFIKKMGTFAGYLMHGLVTMMGAISMLFGYGYLTVVLAKNNFEMTTIILRNSYETSYYALRNGTLRDVREFVEGILLPLSIVIATLLIIGIEIFFLEEHFIYVLPFFTIFMAFGMLYNSFLLKSKYTRMAVDNLLSEKINSIFHAIEILSQRGHRHSHDVLIDVYKNTKDDRVKDKILKGFKNLNNIKVAPFLCDAVKYENLARKIEIIKNLALLGKNVGRNSSDKSIAKVIVASLLEIIDGDDYILVKIHALRALSVYDTKKLYSYLSSSDNYIKIEVSCLFWEMNLYRKVIAKRIKSRIDEMDIESVALLAGRVRLKSIRRKVMDGMNLEDPTMKLFCYYASVKLHMNNNIPNLINLLLYGNKVIFRKGLDLVSELNDIIKRRIVHQLLPMEMIESLNLTSEGRYILVRIEEILEVCGAKDEKECIKMSALKTSNIFNQI